MAIFLVSETDQERELVQAGEAQAVEIFLASADDPAGVTVRVVVECPAAAIGLVRVDAPAVEEDSPVEAATVQGAEVIDREVEVIAQAGAEIVLVEAVTDQVAVVIARVEEETDLAVVGIDPAGVAEVGHQAEAAIGQVVEVIAQAGVETVLVEAVIDRAAVVTDQAGVGVQAVEIDPAGIVQARGIVPSLAAVEIDRQTGTTATTGTMAIIGIMETTTIGTTATTTM
ncbi:hypothetical protein [Planctomicrobium piriforme]|nr:hypothetical protein [Planctomicrobium piriforme]